MLEKPTGIIIAGSVVERDGRYLLMQEMKSDCRGLWNLPAGHVDPGETIIEAAVREAREETGHVVELTGVCQIGNRARPDAAFTSIIFTAKIVEENVMQVNPEEVMDLRWFDYEEIIAMRDQIRNPDLLIGSIENCRKGIIAPLTIVQAYGSENSKQPI